MAFQGPTSYPNDIRWIGTEAGVAPADTWSATEDSQSYGAGLKDGQVWAPAEADTCIRTADCCAPGGEPKDSGSSGCWVRSAPPPTHPRLCLCLGVSSLI